MRQKQSLKIIMCDSSSHLFIHYGDLYSASSRLLLRSAPDPCTAKKKSFEARVECVRKNPGEQSLRQRKPIPHRGANHRECTCHCSSSPTYNNVEVRHIQPIAGNEPPEETHPERPIDTEERNALHN